MWTQIFSRNDRQQNVRIKWNFIQDKLATPKKRAGIGAANNASRVSKQQMTNQQALFLTYTFTNIFRKMKTKVPGSARRGLQEAWHFSRQAAVEGDPKHKNPKNR